MQIHEIIDPALIDLDLDVESADQAIQCLVHRLVEAGKLPAEHETEATLSLLKREALAGTNFGNGLAVPHAKFPFVPDFRAALGLIHRGVHFGGQAVDPVRVVFLLLSPEWDPDGHLRIMSDLARLADPFLYEKLTTARSPEAILSRLRRPEGEAPAS